MEISTQNIQLSVGKKNILRGINIELYNNEISGLSVLTAAVRAPFSSVCIER